MNKITLLGRVGQDPETKHVGDTQLTKFSLATSEKYKNKQGEKVEDTTWHAIEVWGKQAETVEKFVKKGDQLLVIGQQRNEKHEDKYYSKVRMQEFEFAGSNQAHTPKPEQSHTPKKEYQAEDSGDDKLPF